MAILKPTPSEILQVNAALQKCIDSAPPSDRAILQKVESLLMLQPPRRNVAATCTPNPARRSARHEAFVEIAKKGNLDLPLDGDSIPDYWGTDEV